MVRQEYSIDIIICPPNPLLYYLSNNIDLSIFAQHVDYAKVGSSTGAIVPELLTSIGVSGSLINHSEKRIPFNQIENLVKKFKELNFPFDNKLTLLTQSLCLNKLLGVKTIVGFL